MPLEEIKCERILTIMRGLDIEAKLKAINEARKLFKESFTEGMSEKDYAYSAHTIETFYNLIREELRVSQIRVKKDTQASASTSKPSKAKSKTPKPAMTMDFGQMMAEFAKFKKGPESTS